MDFTEQDKRLAHDLDEQTWLNWIVRDKRGILKLFIGKPHKMFDGTWKSDLDLDEYIAEAVSCDGFFPVQWDAPEPTCLSDIYRKGQKAKIYNFAKYAAKRED